MMIDNSYKEHFIFNQLQDYSDFYKNLSLLIFGFITKGTNTICNIDSYVFSSIKGTVDSIYDILYKGRINDSYALLRKYYDSVIINIYSNLYLNDNFNIENFIVDKINNWIKGVEKLPDINVMVKYIKKSKKLESITKLIDKGDTYKNIRNRCNDNMHYNFYINILLNDNEIFLGNRLKYLNTFSKDITNIFILHFSYLFYLNDYYMMSTDYVDSLECGLQPEENSQYFVATFIQKMYDKVIKTNRNDIALELKNHTFMKLE
jgi:hypothetical protein